MKDKTLFFILIIIGMVLIGSGVAGFLEIKEDINSYTTPEEALPFGVAAVLVFGGFLCWFYVYASSVVDISIKEDEQKTYKQE